MSTNTATQYSSAEDLLSDVAEATHDVELGKHTVQVTIPVTYFETFSLEQDTNNFVKEMKEGKCPPDLKPYVKRKREELIAAYTLHRLVSAPKLSLKQALDMLNDGIKVKAIIATIESLRVHHLQKKAVEEVEEGKDA